LFFCHIFQGIHLLPGKTILLLTCLAFLLVQTNDKAAARSKPPWRSWTTTLNKDNPLVGKIWDVKEKMFLTPFELAGRLASSDYILMGEIHDNPDHHRLQAWLIRNIVYLDRHPAVVMEMINLSQGLAVEEFITGRKKKWRQSYQRAKKRGRLRQWRKKQGKLRRLGPSKQAEAFGPAIGWQASGWPKWSTYQPIALAAFGQHLRIKPGNPDRSDTRIVSRQGFAALGGPRRTTLGLDQPLEEAREKSLLAEIKASHCDLLPEQALKPMSHVQRYRDAVMAEQLIKVGITSGAILIAGNGHVRNDRGVPWYLEKRAPFATHASLMIIEADDRTSSPDGLIPRDESGKVTADFVWYTPGKKRPDPCNGMARHFKKRTIKKKVTAAKITGSSDRKN